MTTNEGDRKDPKRVVNRSPAAGRSPIIVGKGGLTIAAAVPSNTALRGRVESLKLPEPDIEISENEGHQLADLYNELFEHEEVFEYLSSETDEGSVILINLPVPAQVSEYLDEHGDLVHRLDSKIGVPSSAREATVGSADRVTDLYRQIFDLLEGLARPSSSS